MNHFSKMLLIRFVFMIGLLIPFEAGARLVQSSSTPIVRHEECVDCPDGVGTGSYALKVDSQGYLRLVIGSDYYWQDASGWHGERSLPDDARSDSLTFDSNGFPRFLYITPDQILGYAYKDLTGWHHEDIYQRVNLNWSTPFYPSLYIDPSGNPHIAFLSDLSARYAYKDSSGWHVMVAFYYNNYGCQSLTPFAVDPSGDLHLAVKCSLSSYLLTWTGATWTVAVLPLDMEPQFLFYDHSGYIHLVYKSDYWLISMLQDATGWLPSVNIAPNNNIQNLSAVVDANEHIRFSFYDSSDTVIKVAQQSTGLWDVAPLPNAVHMGTTSSLGLDPEDNSRIVYTEIDLTDQDLGSQEYAYHDQSGWHAQMLWQNDWFYRVHAMAFDSNGNPAVAYKSARKGLLYAVRSGQGWKEEVVDTDRNSGLLTALALGPDGNPQMVYALPSQNVFYLKYANRKNNQWQIQDVPNATYDEDIRPSLQIDSSNLPHLVINASVGINHEPRYYSFDGTQWTYEVIQSASPAGLYWNTLRLDVSGQPHIVSTTNAGALYSVIYSYKDQSGWHQETIDDHSAAFTDQSLALDSLGVPHTVFTRNNTIQYASRAASGWISQKVADSGGEAYLAIGPDGQAEIVLWSVNPTSLVYVNPQDGVQRQISLNVTDKTIILQPITILIDKTGKLDFLYMVYDHALKFVQISDGFGIFLPAIQK